MSYLVLARKWRPKNFLETVGQEHVLKALTNALDSERLHHAYLFAGTRGVGKTTIARVFAKSLNCDTGVTSAPCGECSACMEIDEGRFVDLIEVDAASRTKVDDTRDLLDNVQYAPARGRFKVYLIDEVHMLSKSSFNALLKTLEEPPPHVKFLLATTDPQKLPVTVLSRCLQFNLKRLTLSLIRERLELICNAESIPFEAGALTAMARAADGSLRDALSLLDQAIAFCGGDVTADAVASMLGTIDRQHIGRLLDLLASADAAGLINAIAEIDEQFPDYARLLDDLASTLQRVAVYQTVGYLGNEDSGAEAGDNEVIAAVAGQMSAEDVQLFYQIALLGRRDLHLSPEPRGGVEMTLLRMLTFQPDGVAGQGSGGEVRKSQGGSSTAQKTPANVMARAAAPGKPVAAAAAMAIAEVATPEITKPVTATKWQEPDWSNLVGQIALSGFNKQLASNCAYVRRQGDVVHLKLDGRSESYLTRSRSSGAGDCAKSVFRRGNESRHRSRLGGR